MEARELFSELKTFLGFGDDDVARLLSVKPWVEANGRKITDAFYETIQGTPVLAPFVDGRVEKLKQTHTRWMVELVGGKYDDAYFDSRWRIGVTHVRIGLDPIWVDGTMALIRNKILIGLADTEADAHRLAEAQGSLIKVCDLDLAIINLAYAEDRLERLTNFTGMKRALIENIIRLPKQ